MAFTRSWDEALPDGATTAASDIDLIIRQLKVDIRERLEDVSTYGSDTDPLALLASAVEPVAPTFYGRYDDNAGAGSKVSDEGRGKLLVIRYVGQTDASGFVIIDLTEFTETFDITQAITLAAGTTGNVGTNIPHRIISTGVDAVADTMTFQVYDSTDTAIVSGDTAFTAVLLIA